MKAKVKNIIDIMEKYFPPYLAESWDNVGLQIGSADKVVEKIVISLDLDKHILKYAIEQKADMIISHHPLLFKPLKNIIYESAQGSLVRDIIRSDITAYCAHTNLDAAERGLNQKLAELLGLQYIEPLDAYKREDLYKLAVFVPASHAEDLRNALNEAGAGCTGKYSDCSFRVRGIGNFRPGENTHPYIGTKGILEEVDEYKLETVVYRGDLPDILKVMQKVHPYEEIAYDIYPLINEGKVFSMGRKGILEGEMALEEVAFKVKKHLKLDSIRVVGDLRAKVRTAAVVSGAGAGFINQVISQGIDLLITGDLKYHEARDAEAAGLSVIDAGHQGTEEIVASFLYKLLTRECKARDMQIEFVRAYSDPCFKNL